MTMIAFFIASVTKELLLSKVKKEIHIEVFNNNNSLYEALTTKKSVLDRRLRIGIVNSLDAETISTKWRSVKEKSSTSDT